MIESTPLLAVLRRSVPERHRAGFRVGGLGFGVWVQGLGALLSCAQCDDWVHVAWLQEGGAAAAGGSSRKAPSSARTAHAKNQRAHAKKQRTGGSHAGSPREGRAASASGRPDASFYSPPASAVGGRAPAGQVMSMAKSMAYLCAAKAQNMDPKYRHREMQMEAYRIETERRQVCL